MNTQDCLNELRNIKDVSFATVDEKGKPRVRIIDVMLVEKERLIFCTAKGKAFYHQLIQRPEVEIVGMNAKYQMLRLHGIAKKMNNEKEWIDRIFENNLSMNDVYPDESRYILEPFCIEEGQIEYFDLGKHPIDREVFVLGRQHLEVTGFEIQDTCIGCSKCARACPMQCIKKGKPFVIDQNHCLHCGNCVEVCPVHAIQKRG